MRVDWTTLNRNPVSEEVRAYLLEFLRKKKAGRLLDFMSYLRSFVQGRTVLDIGVVEHDISHIHSAGWKHKHIRDWSASVVGIDILAEEVALLQKMGFNVLKVDATSDVDLGMKFERITICEVIEHVDNPVNLMRFAGRHLQKDGRILVTTPNPYWFQFIWEAFRAGTLVDNAEHISWVSPSMAVEIGRRAGLELDEYWILRPYGKTPLRRMVRRAISMLFGDSELFTFKFFYIYKKPEG